MTKSFIGRTIYVVAVVPATNNAAGFEALTWVKAGGPQVLPQLGVTHSLTDVPDLESGFTAALKGAGAGTDTTATFRNVPSDAGQAILKTAAHDGDGLMSVKIVDGSGVNQAPVTGDPVEYAHGIAHSYQPNQGDTTTHEGFTVGFRQNDLTVEGTEPA